MWSWADGTMLSACPPSLYLSLSISLSLALSLSLSLPLSCLSLSYQESQPILRGRLVANEFVRSRLSLLWAFRRWHPRTIWALLEPAPLHHISADHCEADRDFGWLETYLKKANEIEIFKLHAREVMMTEMSVMPFQEMSYKAHLHPFCAYDWTWLVFREKGWRRVTEGGLPCLEIRLPWLPTSLFILPLAIQLAQRFRWRKASETIWYDTSLIQSTHSSLRSHVYSMWPHALSSQWRPRFVDFLAGPSPWCSACAPCGQAGAWQTERYGIISLPVQSSECKDCPQVTLTELCSWLQQELMLNLSTST